ncbi:MAG: hypothetical protein J6Q41_01390 [Firmicutes bacterium]|nr:hypothetical protein [Bacillota bacterium]
MKTGTIIAVAAAGAIIACGLFAHRRVICALINGEEMPKAPAWHVWVPEDMRREEE